MVNVQSPHLKSEHLGGRKVVRTCRCIRIQGLGGTTWLISLKLRRRVVFQLYMKHGGDIEGCESLCLFILCLQIIYQWFSGQYVLCSHTHNNNHFHIMTAQHHSKKGVILNYGQKHQVILHWDHQKWHIDHNYSLAALGRWVKTVFNLSTIPGKSTLSDFLNKHCDKILNAATQDKNIKWTHIVTCQPVEDALVLWVLQKQYQKRHVSYHMIQKQGCQFLWDFNLSESTLQFSDH